MKITKNQLKKIITEARSGMLGGIGFGVISNEAPNTGFVKEAIWDQQRVGSGIIDFAKAYASLGAAVQEQVNEVVSAWFDTGRNSNQYLDAAMSVNPAAIRLAVERLSNFDIDSDEYYEIVDALQTALTLD